MIMDDTIKELLLCLPNIVMAVSVVMVNFEHAKDMTQFLSFGSYVCKSFCCCCWCYICYFVKCNNFSCFFFSFFLWQPLPCKEVSCYSISFGFFSFLVGRKMHCLDWLVAVVEVVRVFSVCFSGGLSMYCHFRCVCVCALLLLHAICDIGGPSIHGVVGGYCNQPFVCARPTHNLVTVPLMTMTMMVWFYCIFFTGQTCNMHELHHSCMRT